MRIQSICLSVMFLAATVPAQSQEVQVRIDTTRRQVIVTAGPLHIPRAGYEAQFKEKYLRFDWPAAGWVRGYEMDLLDSLGNKLPRELFHHAGMANLERRSLISPRMERVFAAGRETAPVMLPANTGVPFSAGNRISLYYALVNQSEADVHGATLRFTFAWIPQDSKKIANVLPVYLGAHQPRGPITFDIPPGTSSTSSEFTLPISGRFRGMGGHMHDYAREIRLEDVETNRVLVRLGAKLSGDGKILGMTRTKFIFTRGGLRLTASRRYRIVAVYDNPGCKAISGAMGLIVGPFIPDDISTWPTVDASDPILQKDIEHLSTDTEIEHHHEGLGGQDDAYETESGKTSASCTPEKNAY